MNLTMFTSIYLGLLSKDNMLSPVSKDSQFHPVRKFKKSNKIVSSLMSLRSRLRRLPYWSYSNVVASCVADDIYALT